MKLSFVFLFSFVFLLSSAQISDWAEEQATGFTTPQRGIKNISIVNENVVWILAFDGSANEENIQEFSRTTNQGDLWIPGTIDVGNPELGIGMIHAVSENIAWVVAHPRAMGQTSGIYKTIDGGNTWLRQNTAFNDPMSYPNVVYFWDENNGFCQGDPVDGYFELYTTTNGGDNWVRVPSANIPPPVTGEYGEIGKICVIDYAVWWYTNHYRLYRSYDFGNSFEVMQAPICDFGYACRYNHSFGDDNNGYTNDDSGVFWTSSDGGETWDLEFPDTGLVFGGDIFAIPNTDVVFTASYDNTPGMSYSLDRGQNWEVIDDTSPLTDIQFLNTSLGWVGSFNTSATEGGIYKFENTISVPEIEVQTNIVVLPNPFTDSFQVTANQNITAINIYTALGQQVFSQQPNSISYNIDTSLFPNNTYIVQVSTNNTSRIIKVIK